MKPRTQVLLNSALLATWIAWLVVDTTKTELVMDTAGVGLSCLLIGHEVARWVRGE